MTSDVVSAKLFDAAGTEKGVVPLTASVFGGKIKEELVHGTVRWQRAKRRAGTHDVLTRSEIKGGAKKPFKQKGTGSARAGSTVSPLMVGGAVVHGPTPRKYDFRLSKKMRKGALQSALAAKTAAGSILVIEGMDKVSGKTREAAELLKKLGVAGSKVLVIVPNEQSAEREKFALGLRNIEGATVVPVSGVNVYDLMNAKHVVCVRAALGELDARVGVVAK
jgi:large subunit ribosomal protein L4